MHFDSQVNDENVCFSGLLCELSPGNITVSIIQVHVKYVFLPSASIMHNGIF